MVGYEGWYFVCFKSEIKKDAIKKIKIFNENLILFSGTDEKIAVMSAFCPHLGANLAYGGKVKNGNIICPFHGYKFNSNGECVETGYGEKPYKETCIRTYPVFVSKGMIFIYYSGCNSEKEIPPPESLHLYDKKYKSIKKTWNIIANLIDITENTADIEHLVHVHNYDSVSIVEKPTIVDEILFAKYKIKRTAGFIGRKKSIVTDFEVQMYGPGTAIVQMNVETFGMKMTNYILSRPNDNREVTLTMVLNFHDDFNPIKFSPIFAFLPKKLGRYFIMWSVFKGFKEDVELDFPIWENKIYLDKPSLNPGDGPINFVRNYAKRFLVNF